MQKCVCLRDMIHDSPIRDSPNKYRCFNNNHVTDLSFQAVLGHVVGMNGRKNLSMIQARVKIICKTDRVLQENVVNTF